MFVLLSFKIKAQAALTSLGVKSLPGVLVLNSDDQSVMAIDIGNGTVPEILRAVRNQAAKTALRNPANFRRTSTSATWGTTTSTERARVEEKRSEVLRRRYSVFLSDLEKTVLFALKNEVAVQSKIDHGALKQFVDVLIHYFPQNSRLLPHLIELSAGLNNTSVTGSEISDLLTPITSVEDSEDWIGCKGSAPKFGGYPCGLWQLWHTLTLAQGEEDDPRVVLRAMVTYVRHFFSCQGVLRPLPLHGAQRHRHLRVGDVINRGSALPLGRSQHSELAPCYVYDVSISQKQGQRQSHNPLFQGLHPGN